IICSCRIAQPVITRLTEDAVPYYRDGGVPGFDSPRPSVVIFFASTRKSDIYKNYKRFARERHGDFHLTELIDRGIEKWAHQPVFVAMKPLETISKANTLYEDISYESMVEFIEENQHPSVSLHFLLKFQAYLNNKSETVGPQRKKLFDYWFESVHKQSLDSAAIPLLVLRFLQSVTLKLTYLPFPCVCVETLFPAIFAFFRFFS
ncbi:unnamed protein product, partial [Heligmosomoides polygyrus]|uniref:SEFIR domain-containing protein n=1 Tax=Heligmosomoides polygyrus TaxID=6339 RepID=A0A183F7E8_HELPZ